MAVQFQTCERSAHVFERSQGGPRNQMGCVRGNLPCSLPRDGDTSFASDRPNRNFVPHTQRNTQRVKARAQIRACCRNRDQRAIRREPHKPSSAATASRVAAITVCDTSKEDRESVV